MRPPARLRWRNPDDLDFMIITVCSCLRLWRVSRPCLGPWCTVTKWDPSSRHPQSGHSTRVRNTTSSLVRSCMWFLDHMFPFFRGQASCRIFNFSAGDSWIPDYVTVSSKVINHTTTLGKYFSLYVLSQGLWCPVCRRRSRTTTATTTATSWCRAAAQRGKYMWICLRFSTYFRHEGIFIRAVTCDTDSFYKQHVLTLLQHLHKIYIHTSERRNRPFRIAMMKTRFETKCFHLILNVKEQYLLQQLMSVM